MTIEELGGISIPGNTGSCYFEEIVVRDYYLVRTDAQRSFMCIPAQVKKYAARDE